jgi:hypothetical protein
MGVKANKQEYFEKLKSYLEDYKSIFIVTVDNVRYTIPDNLGALSLTREIGLLPADARDP